MPDLRPVRQSMIQPTRFGMVVWIFLAAIQVVGFALIVWWIK